MEFVDYKCLESLLIEGEEMIATEGFIDNVKNMILGILKTIGGFIDKLINIIKSKFSKKESDKDTREDATSIIKKLMKYSVDLCNEATYSASLIITTNQNDSIESLDEKLTKHVETMDDYISKFNYLYNNISNFYNYYVVFDSIEDHNAILRKLIQMKSVNNETIKKLEYKHKNANFTYQRKISSSVYNKLIKIMNETTSCLAKLIKVSSEMPWYTKN